MIRADDVAEILRTLRRVGGEPETVEAKRAEGGLPRSVRETLSAFSNTDGGTLLLGVDEGTGFGVVDLPDPVALRDALVQMASDDLTPALRIATDIVEVEGRLIVVAVVPPARSDHRPVFVTQQGVSTGSYLRTGDGDRRMTEAEIGLLFAARNQPRDDAEAVPGTSAADLDQDQLRRTLGRVRRESSSLARSDDATVLRRLGITTGTGPEATLTLAGLLTFGEYPQQWFPQLMMSVVVHPPDGDRTTRFLDNATLRGSIPEIVRSALDMLRRNLATRAVMSDTGRTDRLEFPLEGVREALVNALMHRDYSGITRGTQVQVELFPDRLVVRSPGGLYGGIAIDQLGEEGVSSSRNTVLASLLADAYMPNDTQLVAENRSSGVPEMIRSARENGLPRPEFRSTVTSFVVTMNRSQLLAPAVRQWIAGLGLAHLTTAQEIALAMMHRGYVTNGALREWGVDQVTAGRTLRELVDTGLVLREGGRRYARYVLDPGALATRQTPADASPARGTGPTTGLVAEAAESTTEAVAAAIQAAGRAVAAREIEEVTGFRRPTIVKHVNLLIDQGRVAATGAPRSPQRRYHWVAPTNDRATEATT